MHALLPEGVSLKSVYLTLFDPLLTDLSPRKFSTICPWRNPSSMMEATFPEAHTHRHTHVRAWHGCLNVFLPELTGNGGECNTETALLFSIIRLVFNFVVFYC